MTRGLSVLVTDSVRTGTPSNKFSRSPTQRVCGFWTLYLQAHHLNRLCYAPGLAAESFDASLWSTRRGGVGKSYTLNPKSLWTLWSACRYGVGSGRRHQGLRIPNRHINLLHPLNPSNSHQKALSKQQKVNRKLQMKLTKSITQQMMQVL